MSTGQTVKPNAEAVKTARTNAGLTGEELAEKAGLSPKTISNVENGKEVIIPTLRAIAEALTVPYETLLHTEQQACAKIVVITTYLLSGFGEEERKALIAMLTQPITCPGPMRIVEVKEGSTRVTIELSAEDARAVIEAFRAGRYAGTPITDIFAAKTISPIDHCPALDDLKLFVKGQLDDHRAAVVAAHLATCASCRSLIAHLRTPIFPFNTDA